MSHSRKLGLGRAVRIGLLALPIALLAGCVKQDSDGDVTTFRYELYYPILVLLGGCVAAPLGWVVRRRIWRLGWMMLILGPIAAVYLAPGLVLDRVVVSKDSLSIQTGLLGQKSNVEVNFDDLSTAKVQTLVTMNQKGTKRTQVSLSYGTKTGGWGSVDLSHDLARAATDLIVDRLAAKGIELGGESGPEKFLRERFGPPVP